MVENVNQVKIGITINVDASVKNIIYVKQIIFGNLNHFHNILRLFDVFPNFLFSTSETMRDYYL